MKDKDSSSNFQESIYDTEAPQKIAEIKDLKVREIMTTLLGSNKFKVLDIGCGDGSLLEPFCSSQECYGIDVSENQLTQAKARGIKTYRVDLESKALPFDDESFDLIVCSETIEHILNADNLLHEIHRTLRLGGTFILTFPNINQPVSWFMQILLDLPPRFSARYKSPHVRDYTLRIIRVVLTNFGFNIKNAAGTYVYPYEGKFSQWVAARFPRMGEKIIVVSKKQLKTATIKSQSIVWNVMELSGNKTM